MQPHDRLILTDVSVLLLLLKQEIPYIHSLFPARMIRKLIALWLVLLSFVGSNVLAQEKKTSLQDTFQIPEIIIKARTSVKVNGDTISYTVDSFYKNPSATTEDVLKKLPGVDVDKDGKITIQGKELAKIYVNGKEYDAGDLRTITQNLPAEMLDKIQIADWYDEDRQFNGVKSGSDKKSINLQFKKKYEHAVYGKASAGYGDKDRYQGGLFANYMAGIGSFTAIAGINNTGVNEINNSNDNTTPKTAGAPGLNKKTNGSIFFNTDKIKKVQLNGSYEVSDLKSELLQSTFRNTYLPGDSQMQYRQSAIRENQSMQHRVTLRSRYKANDKLSLITSINAGLNQKGNSNRTDDANYFNNNPIPSFKRMSVNKDDANAPTVNFSNTLQKSFKKVGRTLSVITTVAYNKNDGSGIIENYNEYAEPSQNNSTQYDKIETGKSVNARLSLQYNEPLSSKSTIGLKYAYGYSWSVTDRKVWNNTLGHILDTAQSRYYENRNVEQPIGIQYTYNSKRLSLTASADAQPYNRKSYTINDTSTKVYQKGINYNPSLSSKYILDTRSSLSFNYSASVTPPDVRQLQPAPDYTDSLNIQIGNPGLKPQTSSSASLTYNYFNVTNQKMAWVTFRGGWVDNKITSKTNIDASRRITQPVNLDGNYNLGLSLNYSQPLISKKLKLSAGLNGSLTNNITITNEQLQKVKNYDLQPNVKLTYTVSEWLEGDINYNYRYSSLASGTIPQTLQTNSIISSATVTLPLNIRFSYFLNAVFNKGLSNSAANNFLLVNASLEKGFNKVKRLSLRVQATDIFNKYPVTQRYFGDNYYEDRTVNRLGRYFMVSVVYRIVQAI